VRTNDDPGALAGALGAGGDRVSGEQLPDTTTARSGPVPPEPLNSHDPQHSVPAADREDEPDHPLPWLANLSLTEYESMRRWQARQYGWRVATLDRLYREARRKAGVPR
jgi:hypothetical protein